MNELILHIGLPKTGTSSLQHFFSASRDELHKQNICYPKTGRPRTAHFKLALACRRPIPTGRDFHELKNTFFDEVAAFDRAVVSSEGFSSIRACPGATYFFGPPDKRNRGNFSVPGILKKRSYRIKTICYLREFLDLACSGYAQKIQNSNLCTDLNNFCAFHVKRPLVLMTKYWKWFSDEFHIGLYDRNQLRNRDIVDDFLSRAGFNIANNVERRNPNPTISGNLLAFKLFLNSRNLHTPKAYNVFSELAAEDPSYRGRFRVLDAEASALRDRFREYNKKVSRYVGEVPLKSFEDGNLLFNQQTWKHDIDRFLSHPALEHLKDNPKIRDVIQDNSAIEEFQASLSQRKMRRPLR